MQKSSTILRRRSWKYDFCTLQFRY